MKKLTLVKDMNYVIGKENTSKTVVALDFTGATLQPYHEERETFDGFTFHDCDFTASTVEYYTFTNCTFIGCTFTDFSFGGGYFHACRFDGNTFTNVTPTADTHFSDVSFLNSKGEGIIELTGYNEEDTSERAVCFIDKTSAVIELGNDNQLFAYLNDDALNDYVDEIEQFLTQLEEGAVTKEVQLSVVLALCAYLENFDLLRKYATYSGNQTALVAYQLGKYYEEDED